MTVELKDLQSRFLHSLVRQSEAVTGALAEPSRRRLSVYQSGYIARLRANLEAVYPALERHLGEAFFAALARGYIARRPSRHFSLYDFGAGFAEFLVETQEGQSGEAGLSLPLDIARYEQALSVAGRAAAWPDRPDGRGAAPDLLAQAALCAAGFDVNPSCAILTLTADVQALVADLRAGAEPGDVQLPPVEAEPVRVAVWRNGAQTRSDRVTAQQAGALQAEPDRTSPDSAEPLDPSWLMKALQTGLVRPRI